MIRHQHIGMNAYLAFLSRGLEVSQVAEVIRLFKEAISAVISALYDVV